MVLGLHMCVPGDPEPLLIGRAVVKWVKGMEFGVKLTPNRDVAQRITKLITEKVKGHHQSASRRA